MPLPDDMPFWQPLGAPAPDALTDARLLLHHAVQIVASVGYTYLPHQPDWHEVSVSWDDAAAAFVGGLADGERAFRAALRVPDLTLQLRDSDGAPVAAFALAGRTLEDGYAWLERAIARHRGRPPEPLTRPDHVLPDHPVFTGAPFSLEAAPALAELARWYGNAARVLQAVSTRDPRASPVRCWPHHFDIAVLITLDPDLDPEAARAVGVGLSPGDGSYPYPYWYLSPYPAPPPQDLPPLSPPAVWHTKGWTGAVLTGPDLVAAGADQPAVTARYLREALTAAFRLLDPVLPDDPHL